MRTSYHVHTKWSDGIAELGDYITAAADAGLDEVGFSDHYALLADGRTTEWSMPAAAPAEYLAAIRDASHQAPSGLMVRGGLEVDFVPAAFPQLRKILEANEFNYLIGSVHIVGELAVDGSPGRWAGLSTGEMDEVFRVYWTYMREMAETRLFDIAGHLDVIGKAEIRPSFDVSPLVLRALDAIQEAEMAVELNTSGWHSSCNHCFPEEWILRECVEREIPILVTADAHEPGNIVRDFDRAEHLLSEMGSANAINVWLKRV